MSKLDFPHEQSKTQIVTYLLSESAPLILLHSTYVVFKITRKIYTQSDWFVAYMYLVENRNDTMFS